MAKAKAVSTEVFPVAPAIWIHQGDTNMSKSFKGLLEDVKVALKREMRKGDVFVFFNKARTKCKLLFLQSGGTVIVYKSLDSTIFEVERGTGYRRIARIHPMRLLNDIKNANAK